MINDRSQGGKEGARFIAFVNISCVKTLTVVILSYQHDVTECEVHNCLEQPSTSQLRHWIFVINAFRLRSIFQLIPFLPGNWSPN